MPTCVHNGKFSTELYIKFTSGIFRDRVVRHDGKVQRVHVNMASAFEQMINLDVDIGLFIVDDSYPNVIDCNWVTNIVGITDGARIPMNTVGPTNMKYISRIRTMDIFFNHHTQMVIDLIKEGIVTVRNTAECLKYAVGYSYIPTDHKLIQYLMTEYGAVPNSSHVDMAIFRGQWEILKYLSTVVDITNITDTFGNIYQTITVENIKQVSAILPWFASSFAKWQIYNYDMCGGDNDDYSIIQLLMEHIIMSKNNNHRQLAMSLIEYDNIRTLKYLVTQMSNAFKLVDGKLTVHGITVSDNLSPGQLSRFVRW